MNSGNLPGFSGVLFADVFFWGMGSEQLPGNCPSWPSSFVPGLGPGEATATEWAAAGDAASSAHNAFVRLWWTSVAATTSRCWTVSATMTAAFDLRTDWKANLAPKEKHVQAGALVGEEMCCGMSADGEAGCPRALEGTKRSKQRLGWWEMVGRFECDVEPQALSSANLPNTLTGHDRAMEHSPKPVPNSLRKP